MSEEARLQELEDFKILDTPYEQELDELVAIASAICDTPIALVSLVDNKRLWFKSKIGIDIKEAARDTSFCQYTLDNPKEVLVVEDPLNDVRFKDNPFVLGNPHIRFYAAAPLETTKGNVLGTLSIIDSKPRTISESQKIALQLLAKRVMNYLETSKMLAIQGDQLEMQAEKLRKLTNYAPGALFQLKMEKDGRMFFPFLSQGFAEIHPELDMEALKTDATICFEVVHPDDVGPLQKSLEASFANLSPWSQEYRVVSEDGDISWHWANAKPERKEDGAMIWHGTFQDITERKEYMNTLEQILFDISHVIRKPVANMLGLTTAIEEYDLDPESLKTYVSRLKIVSEEMDSHIKKLNEVYMQRKSQAQGIVSAVPAEED
ncbi:GAF domain-containing protein [Salinimicrobium sp. GXAS 041]|uniref:GAF domain-containing protein n=1 Tax=Salinimicrobium sp. GXAS 041 TaxID=3400806 RepID=UPI003C7373DC